MEELPAHKMTVVTYPDYHIDPGATRLMSIGNYRFNVEVQDAVGLYWPDKDVSIYLGDSAIAMTNSAEAIFTWTYYQLSIAEFVIVNSSSWHWIWPALDSLNCAKIIVDQKTDELLSRSLNLTYPGRVFHTTEDAVKYAASCVP
ncbi:hypothetical protein D3C71_924190 [compost metagenome]